LQNNKSLTCVRSKFGHFEAHSSWRLAGAMRSSRSSGRSATTAAVSVSTFKRAHNPVPNIIIPSPPRVLAHDQLPRDPRPAGSTIDDHRSSLDLLDVPDALFEPMCLPHVSRGIMRNASRRPSPSPRSSPSFAKSRVGQSHQQVPRRVAIKLVTSVKCPETNDGDIYSRRPGKSPRNYNV